MNLESSLDSLKGIGEKTKQVFHKAGIENLGDLVSYYPRDYERYEAPKKISEVCEGEVSSVMAHLTTPLATVISAGFPYLQPSVPMGQMSWHLPGSICLI